MKEYLDILKKVGLFKDINASDLNVMYKCLGSEVKAFCKGEIILLSGDKPENVGIVLSGQIHVVKEDCDGNRSLLTSITAGDVFAEALCCAGVLESPVTVQADTDSVVMLLRFSRILNICSNSCSFRTQLIANMLKLIANKNLILQNRMGIISLKSIRAKVTRYLASFSPIYGQEITIPFNREELADFLCVERSALSHELARMKKDGLIVYRKNRFILYGYE